jgi:uncharacterized protein (TIGR02266 family)
MQVALRAAGQVFVGTSSNVGVGGLFVLTEQRLSIGERLTLEFTLPDHVHPTSIDAEVRWIDEAEGRPAGLGMRFLNPSIGAMVALYDVLRRLDEDRTPPSRSR